MTYTIPYYAHTTGRFGDFESWRANPHRGHDVAPPGGGTFPSWTPGVVVAVYYHSCLGWVVVVQNRDGAYIGVSHLTGAWVKVGQTVEIGTGLGGIGNTGSCTTGRHAHITVSWSSSRPEAGSVVDPVQYANNAVPQASSGAGYGLTKEAQTYLQTAMKKENRYAGVIDGVFGLASVKGMQQWLKDLGYLPASYLVDGIPGTSYGKALQTLARDKGGYTGVIDGKPGTATSTALVKWAKLVIETDAGSSGEYAFGLTMEAQRQIQAALKFLKLYTGVVDGVFGPASVAAMQQYLKNEGFLGSTYGVDGKPGTVYGKALQTLAQDYGYTGAIDGLPGDLTSGALIAWAADVLDGAEPVPVPVPTPEEAWPTHGTFGIDVASPQRDIDFVKAKADGAEFVIIKMGGLNVLPQYVAPYYKVQVERARAAGLRIGHYYLLGLGQTPEQQAAFMVANLHQFDPKRDVLAFDNEVLDANGHFFEDPDAARFVREVRRLTGIDAKRRWHYAGANDYRQHAPWPELEDEGVRFWWAAYGANDGTRDHEPSLQGSIPRWDVHQFGSKVKIAGYELDGNWSPFELDELFAEGTVAVPDTDPEPEPEPEPECQSDAILADIAALVAKYSA
jgi:peptidoglycan hydrolase-like protein with peptidoglycan-binding domain/GH25 family lysozyme M1 (1,4-beta-N-acetylmuramidase)